MSSTVAVLRLATACGAVEQTASELPDARSDATTGAVDAQGPLGADDAGSGDADSGDSAFDAGRDAASAPTIASVTPDKQYEGSDITITGTSFDSTVQVKIRNVQATVVSATATEVVVTVPDFPEVQPGPPVGAPLVLSVPGHGEATYSGFGVRGN